MDEQKRKNLSIASLSANLAWNLLTPEEQRQLLAYLEKVREKEQIREKTQEKRSVRRYSRLSPPIKKTRPA